VTPQVSVVMSVYNEAHHQVAYVESVLAQRGVELELVLVDDGSTDGSGPLADQLASHDPRVRVLHQENQGLTRALIAGCRAARSEYIARQDSGDLSEPSRLQAQRRALDHHPELSFVSSWTEFCGPELEPLFVKRGSGVALQPTAVLDLTRPHGISDGPTHHGSVTFRRSAYDASGGYRDAFRLGQDWDLWYRLAAVGRFLTVPEVLYRVRVSPSGLSLTHRRRQTQFSRLTLEALKLRSRGLAEDDVLERARRLSDAPPAESARKTMAGAYYFIGECLRRNRDSRSTVYLEQAVALDPLHWRARLRLAQARVLRPRA
jgi:glycosyltransferase involved in cell wall biosynthesis